MVANPSRRSMIKVGLLGLAMAIVAVAPAPQSIAQEDHTGLTRAGFRRNCLMCHSKAAPEASRLKSWMDCVPPPASSRSTRCRDCCAGGAARRANCPNPAGRNPRNSRRATKKTYPLS